jgi:hypothetical protein
MRTIFVAMMMLCVVLGLTTQAKAGNVITARDALGCVSKLHLFEVFLANHPALNESLLRGYLSRKECVYIEGWHYEVLGRVGQYGFYTAIMGGPTGDKQTWDTWYVFNGWVGGTDPVTAKVR